MKKIIASLIVIATLVATASAQITIDRTKRPAADPAPAAAFPPFSETVLPNGLKVFIVESTRQPTVTMRLVVKSGAIYDGKKTGLVSLMAELLDHGTTKRTGEQIAQEIDFIGADLSAGAGSDATFVVASGLTKHQAKILDLFTDVVFNPSFPAEELEKEKTKLYSNLQTEKKRPASLAAKMQGKVLYGEHPYGMSSTEETVKAITVDDLKAFHRANFLPNNASLAIVGDVKAAEILPLIRKAFGAWRKGKVPAMTLPQIPAINGVTIHLVDRPGSVQSNILVSQAGVPRNNADIPEMSVISATLGGGLSGRLMLNLRETHGWTYGASARGNYAKLAGSFAANTEVRNAVTDSAVAEILREMKRIRDEKIPEEELKVQRDYLAGNYLMSLENPNLTATRVQDIDLYGISKDYYKTYASRVSTLSAERAQQLAQKYLSPDNLAIVVVGVAKEIKPKLESLGKVILYDTDFKPLTGKALLDITDDQLYDNYIKAIGGKAASEKITSRTAEGTLKLSAGPQTFEGMYKQVDKAPNKRYLLLKTDAFTTEQRSDGTSASVSQGGQSLDLTGDQLKESLAEAAFNSEIRMKELGNKLSLMEKKTDEGKEVYVAEMTQSSGRKSLMYFDAKTFLAIKQTRTQQTPQGELEIATLYSDYRAVDGVMLPFKIVQNAGPATFDITVKSYQHNAATDDDLFKKK
ncbi:MAG: insulinase family protein [Rhizobacter sp.]|nr:insulinase family protein [Chlorobiales bacterium]